MSEYLAHDGKIAVGGRDRLFTSEKKILSSFIHPTPQTLLLGKELGGLGNPGEVRYFTNLFMLLSRLAFRYQVSLHFLSQLSGEGRKVW